MRKISAVLFFVVMALMPGVLMAETKIDINSATLSQLDELAGIGPKYAQGIIDARPFSSVDDLTRVKGIGQKTLQKIKGQGYACVSCTVVPTDASTPSVVIPAQAGIQSDSTSAKNTTNLDSLLQGNDTKKNSGELGAPPAYASGVYINEVLPSPQGTDETDEFVELHNSGSAEVDLSGWTIKDKEGTQTTFKIPDGTKIPSNGFLAFYRPETKIMLNNDADGLELSWPNGTIKDNVSFTKAPTGSSYAKTASTWAWSSRPTPGEKNAIVAKTTAKTSSKSLPKEQKNVKNDLSKAGAADLTGAFDDSSAQSSPWPLFLTVSAVAIVLAGAVIIIKVKLSKTNVRT